jgi:hypothetical protein
MDGVFRSDTVTDDNLPAVPVELIALRIDPEQGNAIN